MRKARTSFFVSAGLLALALLPPRPAAAAWPTDPHVNLPLCTATGNQFPGGSIPDGTGGAIATFWDDGTNGQYGRLRAQRVSAAGTVLWAADGVALCATTTSLQAYPAVIADGAGGAIVSWYDNRDDNGNVYAQRISADGATQWSADGVAICTASGFQYPTRMVSDGAGGAIIVWESNRPPNFDLYAQRISADGVVLWAANGVPLCAVPYEQRDPAIVSDGAGGAIVTWEDLRSGVGHDLYAQRISPGGAVQWAANGVALCAATGDQFTPTIAADGAGGAIVGWFEYRDGHWGTRAQRISPGGTLQWAADGVVLCTGSGDRYAAAAVADGAGGAIVTWYELRNGNWDIYAQRISGAGSLQWAANGVPLCTAAGTQEWPTIVSDGAAGAVVAWVDLRNGNGDIYAQGISASGTVQWTADGVAVCLAGGDQQGIVLAPDGMGGTIASWGDRRNGFSDVYAQRIDADGSLGGLDPTPVQISLVSADLHADRIVLTWYAGGNANTAATVYRSTAGRPWARIGEVTADGTGYLRYTDRVGAPATRVGYRLGIVDEGTEGFYGETWVDLPTLELALYGVQPNPALGGALLVRFTLPSAAPARVELVDVSGRRVAEHEVGSLGAGPHSLDLSEGQRLAPGLYLVRLTQGASARVTRVAVLK